jgi:hypothetical protein
MNRHTRTEGTMLMPTGTQADDIASLEDLAAEAAALGLHADIRQPPGQPPCLHVANPQASVLAENVFTRAGSYYWSWAEPIAGCGQPATAAAILARVLRTADGQ